MEFPVNLTNYDPNYRERERRGPPSIRNAVNWRVVSIECNGLRQVLSPSCVPSIEKSTRKSSCATILPSFKEVSVYVGRRKTATNYQTTEVTCSDSLNGDCSGKWHAA